jgi:hypothetical protein
LESLLDKYTFDQVGLMARCVLRSRAAMLNAILGPVVGATSGADWKGHSVSGGKAKRSKAPSGANQRSFAMGERSSAEAKENGLLNALSRAGLRVATTGAKSAG